MPSLPLVTLKRWMENLEALAISWNICEVDASEGTETVSGRPLIGRPGHMSGTENGSWSVWLTARAHDKREGGGSHGGVSMEGSYTRWLTFVLDSGLARLANSRHGHHTHQSHR